MIEHARKEGLKEDEIYQKHKRFEKVSFLLPVIVDIEPYHIYKAAALISLVLLSLLFNLFFFLFLHQIDLSCMEDVESLGNHGCTVKAFDELLSTYSAKALEFQVVQTEKSQTKGEKQSTKI